MVIAGGHRVIILGFLPQNLKMRRWPWRSVWCGSRSTPAGSISRGCAGHWPRCPYRPGVAASVNGLPASSARAYSRSQHTRGSPGPVPSRCSAHSRTSSAHTPHARQARLQLGYRCRQVPASPLQPAAYRSRPFAATAAASSRSRRIPATDKITVPVAAGQGRETLSAPQPARPAHTPNAKRLTLAE
jgi:hypothetical protein